jgi:hypothetical protein
MNTFDDDALMRERLYRIGATAPVPRLDPPRTYAAAAAACCAPA